MAFSDMWKYLPREVIPLHKEKDSFCNKLDEVLIQIYAMQNEFKERKMKDWRELSLFPPIIIS